ncbi:TRX2-thioredoxin II-like [Oopsacas minuta]|uniref:TRX2-thioredoxin II-like n=1 Tax=Oopsacas minuta TaxID=111878 RepID=A0AAV7JZ03_9METZ|nr:TRX2-thioredoxin II-like [Oopsacas minuta]
MPQLIESPQEAQDTITGNIGLSVFEFFSNWCEACNKFGDDISEFEKEFSQIKFYMMNVENSAMKALMKEYRICAIPSFIFIEDGEYKGIVQGADVEKLRGALKEWVFGPEENISGSCSSDIGLKKLFTDLETSEENIEQTEKEIPTKGQA